MVDFFAQFAKFLNTIIEDDEIEQELSRGYDEMMMQAQHDEWEAKQNREQAFWERQENFWKIQDAY